MGHHQIRRVGLPFADRGERWCGESVEGDDGVVGRIAQGADLSRSRIQGGQRAAANLHDGPDGNLRHVGREGQTELGVHRCEAPPGTVIRDDGVAVLDDIEVVVFLACRVGIEACVQSPRRFVLSPELSNGTARDPHARIDARHAPHGNAVGDNRETGDAGERERAADHNGRCFRAAPPHRFTLQRSAAGIVWSDTGRRLSPDLGSFGTDGRRP